MGSKEHHKALALKWLKSANLMSALFNVESRIIEEIARYSLQRKSNDSGCVDTLELIYSLVEQYELLVKGEIVPELKMTEGEVSNQRPRINNRAIQVSGSEVNKQREEHKPLNVELRPDGKPIDWETWSIEQRLAYNANLDANQITETSSKPNEILSTPVLRSQGPMQAGGLRDDDKFDLKGITHAANF